MGNLISGNNGDGVIITNQANANFVLGNYIGTDISGAAALGNDENGVHTNLSSNDNTIGGNLISGNQSSGVLIQNRGLANQIVSNRIGFTNSTVARIMLINGEWGVWVANADTTVIGMNLVEMDNLEFRLGNVISSNGLGPVWVDPSYEVSILGNSIGSNGPDGQEPGILLTDGSNNDQQAPDLTSVVLTGANQVTIQGTLVGTPSTSYLLQFFSNPSNDPEGQTFVGQETVETDSSGNASFSPSFAPGPLDQIGYTATATDSSGNTSPFSAPVALKVEAGQWPSSTPIFVFSEYQYDWGGVSTLPFQFSSAVPGNWPTPTGTVTFSYVGTGGTVASYSVGLAGGNVTFDASLPQGGYGIGIQYSGDATYAPFSFGLPWYPSPSAPPQPTITGLSLGPDPGVTSLGAVYVNFTVPTPHQAFTVWEVVSLDQRRGGELPL